MARTRRDLARHPVQDEDAPGHVAGAGEVAEPGGLVALEGVQQAEVGDGGDEHAGAADDGSAGDPPDLGSLLGRRLRRFRRRLVHFRLRARLTDLGLRRSEGPLQLRPGDVVAREVDEEAGHVDVHGDVEDEQGQGRRHLQADAAHGLAIIRAGNGSEESGHSYGTEAQAQQRKVEEPDIVPGAGRHVADAEDVPALDQVQVNEGLIGEVEDEADPDGAQAVVGHVQAEGEEDERGRDDEAERADVDEEHEDAQEGHAEEVFPPGG